MTDHADRDSKLGPLKLKSGALPTELHVQCICNFLCPGFLIRLIPLERSGSEILGLGGMSYLVVVIEPV